MLDLGLPPTRPGIAIDVTGLEQVIDYPARDMTITVQAGITMTKLQEILATENQRLPVDVPQPEKATLGGAIATNASGPRRYGYGTLRDYVIGITVVNDEGQEVKAGGRVVKNVAGYDLCKLYTGSLGTLGIITQVTLKLRPRPEWPVVCHCFCAEDEIESLSRRLCDSRIRPVCVDLVNPAAARRTPIALGCYCETDHCHRFLLERLIRDVPGRPLGLGYGPADAQVDPTAFIRARRPGVRDLASSSSRARPRSVNPRRSP